MFEESGQIFFFHFCLFESLQQIAHIFPDVCGERQSLFNSHRLRRWINDDLAKVLMFIFLIIFFFT